MKKTLFSALAALALCLIALPATAEEDVYTLLDENGTALTQYLGECEAGDEYISGDNLHYRVVSVDPQAKTAQLELLGDADMPDVSWLEMEQSLAVSATNNRKIALYCTHSDESYIEGDGTESDEERGGIYDVAAAFDPNYPQPFDPRNAPKLNYGLGVAKYTGSRGKSGASDASAELVARVRNMFDNAGVLWQMAPLGAVDAGGGGTIAGITAQRNIDTIDAGVPVLSMHAPYEIISKVDNYMSYKGMLAVFNEK